MEILKSSTDVYVLKLSIGEEVSSSLISVAEKYGIYGAEVQAIGALKDFEIGYYQLNKKQYKRSKYAEIAELISCAGNISEKDGKPFIHLHATFGLQNFQVIGGHLFSGIVAVSMEAIIRPLPEKLLRKFDEVTGLFLWDLRETS